MAPAIQPWTTVLADPASRKSYADGVRAVDKDIRAFLDFDPEKGFAAAPANFGFGELGGIPFAVKDNIAVKGFRLSCGSKMLNGLDSPYSAPAVLRLLEAGAVVVGKTNLDEFGMGSSTENSAFGVTRNPWNPKLVAGGSSGGSAAAVAARMVAFALGSDTGGSVRQPASFCGVYGLKPTYGVVSRFGLVAYASSLEVIGCCAASVPVARAAFDAMKYEDDRDQSTVVHRSSGRPLGRKIGVLGGDLGLHPDVAAVYQKTQAGLRDLGFQLVPVEFATLDHCVPAYYTIATAEASANLARYTGIRYGLRPEWAGNPEEMVRKSRSAGFGREVKLRILLGTYVLRSGFQDQYYVRAQKIRTAIRNDFSRVFETVDLVLMPTFPVPAFAPGDASMDGFQQKVADKFTTAANLTGLPALAFPAGMENGLPIGMQLVAPAFEEDWLFEAASRYAEVFAPPVPRTALGFGG